MFYVYTITAYKISSKKIRMLKLKQKMNIKDTVKSIYIILHQNCTKNIYIIMLCIKIKYLQLVFSNRVLIIRINNIFWYKTN